ncbi:hypothetical protein FLAG1_09055 [Fusarium langsethiae]|uniref:Uncharacterized protein n=1 Tax=Fusarium langsethiae TaxID=179993 RepID=A0A0N0V5I2_FUSLA|nr:hypothetical protein FLAG1_09055 [Fusarium langsethiae]GKU05733.1 unnamed protein product [Fusarium langsethiae]GKU20070.1 unnamed protein product [Fusarium langsethiae]
MFRTYNTRGCWAQSGAYRYDTNSEPRKETSEMDRQELKHIDETFLKKLTRAPSPAFRTKPNPARLNYSEWPKLPKTPGVEEPTTVRPPLTTVAVEQLVRETRWEEDAWSTKLYHQTGSGLLPTPTEIWVARLREDHRRGILLGTRHEIEEGKQIERVLCRGKNRMTSGYGE